MSDLENPNYAVDWFNNPAYWQHHSPGDGDAMPMPADAPTNKERADANRALKGYREAGGRGLALETFNTGDVFSADSFPRVQFSAPMLNTSTVHQVLGLTAEPSMIWLGRSARLHLGLLAARNLQILRRHATCTSALAAWQ